MKVYLAEEVKESIATRMLPLEIIKKDIDFAVDMMLHGASAFEIVQCKDCKHWASADDYDCEIHSGAFGEEDFCSYGERKGGENE